MTAKQRPAVVTLKSRRPWGILDDVQLRKLHAEGQTAAQIGRALDRTSMMIYRAHERLELIPNIHNEAAREGALKALEAKRSPRQDIAKPGNPNPMNGPPAKRPSYDPENPVLAARSVFRSRLEERSTGFWLDGLPISLGDLIRATNRVRKDAGMEQVGRNPAWFV